MNKTTVQDGILRTLRYGEDCTSTTLAKTIGTTMPAISIALGVLHDKNLIHVSGWAYSERGTPMRVYSWGGGTDALKPRARMQKVDKPSGKTKLPEVRADVAAAWMRNKI